MAETEGNRRVRVRVFHAGTPGELAEQVNGFLAGLPAACVRAIRFQTAAVATLRDDEPTWEYAALVEYEERCGDEGPGERRGAHAGGIREDGGPARGIRPTAQLEEGWGACAKDISF